MQTARNWASTQLKNKHVKEYQSLYSGHRAKHLKDHRTTSQWYAKQRLIEKYTEEFKKLVKKGEELGYPKGSATRNENLRLARKLQRGLNV